MPIDLAQDSHTQPGTKLVQAGSGGQFPAIGQACKTPPGALLRQEFHYEVEGMRGRKQSQQSDAEELRRTPRRAPPGTTVSREQRIDAGVRDVR